MAVSHDLSQADDVNQANSIEYEGAGMNRLMSSLFAQATSEVPEAFSIQNVIDGNATAIAMLGMVIVFFALGFITCAISALPHLLNWLDPWLPKSHHHSVTVTDRNPDEERIVAAIGFVLHTEIIRAKTQLRKTE